MCAPLSNDRLEQLVIDDASAEKHDRFVLLLAEKLDACADHLLLGKDNLLLDVVVDELSHILADLLDCDSTISDQVLKVVPRFFHSVLHTSQHEVGGLHESLQVLPVFRQFSTNTRLVCGVEIYQESLQRLESCNRHLVR